MKIAFINDGIYSYASGAPTAVGGAEQQLWLLARALAAAGWTVVVGVREEMNAAERRVIDNVEFLSTSKGQAFIAWHQFLLSERPDWLLWRGATHLWGPIVELAKLCGVRTIFHTSFDRDVLLRQALFRRRRWWPLYAWGLFRTDRIFGQHEGQLAGLPPRWRSKIYLLPKVGVLPNKDGGTAAATSHTEREQCVAWVGMLRQPKRPDLLIEIAQKMPAVRFLVCGGPTTHRSPPGYGERVMKALQGLANVKFLGQVSPEKAQQVIANSAMLLSTSDEEGFPNTFTQAWSVGTPVVSLKVDPDRIIERMGLGMVSGSPDRAIIDMNALIDSAERREEIAIRAIRYLADNHSEAAVTAAFERAIRGVHS